MTRPSNTDLREAIAEMMGWYNRDGGWFQPQAPDHWNKDNDLDVTNIMSGLLALIQAREQQLLTEARLSERAWAYKNMRDHGTDPQWVEIAKLRMERLQNKTNDGGRDGGL